MPFARIDVPFVIVMTVIALVVSAIAIRRYHLKKKEIAIYIGLALLFGLGLATTNYVGNHIRSPYVWITLSSLCFLGQLRKTLRKITAGEIYLLIFYAFGVLFFGYKIVAGTP